jgi:Fe2+ transport system protein FeoA
LALGEEGLIEEIRLPAARQLHFLELGFSAGEKVRFIRRSPWGDPLEVELLGVRLAIRRSDALSIRVCRLESPS